MRKHIFIVDSDPMMLSLLQQLLEDEDYIVNTASRAEQAFAQLDGLADLYDILIVDEGLPGKMDGLMLAQEAQRRDWFSFSSIIVMSEEVGITWRAKRLGMEYALYKPFDLDALLKLVDHIPRSRRNPILI